MTTKPPAGTPAQRQAKRTAPARAGQARPAAGAARPQTKGRPAASQAQGKPSGKPTGKPTAKPAGKPVAKATAKQPEDKPMVYGAEALAALTVSEARLSRLKGRMILGLTLLLVAMVIWNAVLSATRPEPKLLGMTNDGRVQELPLLDAPLDSQQVLFDWVRRNIPSLYDFN